MSGASQPNAAADPSMEDILASIRRILSEDETQAAQPQATSPAPAAHPVEPPLAPSHADPVPAAAAAPTAPEPHSRDEIDDDVLALDSSMMVEDPPPPALPVPVPPPPPVPAMVPQPVPPPPGRREGALEEIARLEASRPLASRPEIFATPHAEPPPPFARLENLVAPEAAAAAANSIGSLMRRLAAERATPVYRGGPTIEDLVRDEMRPMLKEWLDSHLPGMVERLVRAEIERVVSGALR